VVTGMVDKREDNQNRSVRTTVVHEGVHTNMSSFYIFSVVGFRLFFVRVQFVFSVFIVSLKVCRVRLPVMF